MNNTSSDREVPGMNIHVQEVIRSAELEMLELLQQRAELMKRIGSIKQTLVGLANMFGESVLNERLLSLLDRNTARRQSGLTQSCRAVLMESPTPLTLREVCDLLQKKFLGLLEKHKKPSASITTILNRLVEYDEVRTFLADDKRRVWQWVARREQEDGAFLVHSRLDSVLDGNPWNAA